MSCGIYRITHRESGRAYVGLSVDIERRWKAHKLGTKEKQSHIARAIQKYGVGAFEFDILEILPKESDLLSKAEIGWISKLRTLRPLGFNGTTGGDGQTNFSPDVVLLKAKQAADQWLKPGMRENFIAKARERYSDPSQVEQCRVRTKRVMENPERRRAQSESARTHWQEENYRETVLQNLRSPEVVAKSLAGRRTPEARARFAEITKQRWADPVFRAKVSAAKQRSKDSKKHIV